MTDVPTDLRPLILQGNVVDVLASLPPDSFHCVVTSPPYFGQRLYATDPQIWAGESAHPHSWSPTSPRRRRASADATSEVEKPTLGGRNYDAIGGESCPCGAWRGELGLEPTPDLYISHLADVCDAVRRVLRPDGVFWLNIGDTYSTHPAGVTGIRRWKNSGLNNRDNTGAEQSGSVDKRGPGYKEKDLLMIPALAALELRSRGWYLRADVIWAKPNCMPESARDRPTASHEHVFLLAKSKSYFYDQDAARNPYRQATMPEIGEKYRGIATKAFREYGAQDASNAKRSMVQSLERHNGSNLRNVWWISPQPFPEAHFATFPEDLVETCLRLGTSERGSCPSCGAPWRRITRTSYVKSPVHGPGSNMSGRKDTEHTDDHMVAGRANKETLADLPRVAKVTETLGWEPSIGLGYPWVGRTGNPQTSESLHRDEGGVHRDAVTTGWRGVCNCAAKPTLPCLVLDPFAGSGTTLVVARRLGLRSVGVELNPEYCVIAERRIAETIARVTPNAGYQRRLSEYAEAT